MIWQKVKKNILKYAGFIYIPEGVIDRKESIVLHLSDTPKAIYPNLKRLIEKIQPEYIVHTGDLVDNLKIELYPQKKAQYLKDVRIILQLISLARFGAYVVFGNHDLPKVSDDFPKIKNIMDGETIDIEGMKLMLSHQYRHLKSEIADYKMFGHQPEEDLDSHELNGINAIHILFLESGRVVRIEYPLGTDDIRTGTTRIGI